MKKLIIPTREIDDFIRDEEQKGQEKKEEKERNREQKVMRRAKLNRDVVDHIKMG